MTGDLVRDVEGLLASPASGDDRFDGALAAIARSFGAVTATLHRADVASERLHLVSQLGLPEPLIAITREIPFGKGMAGLCAVRGEPITVCNLQTDESGVARPGAKQTGVAGAITVPIQARDGALLGTLGIGKPGAHDYTAAETQLLLGCASALARALAQVR
jgi:GAF domain-containing protein